MEGEFTSWQKLGRKTYWLFLLKNSAGAIVVFCIMFVFLILASLGPNSLHLGENGSRAMQAIFVLGFLGFATIFIVLMIIAFLWTHFEYKNYTFIMGEDALEVARGIFTKENISIPYNRIEDINIEQSFLYQMLGVCSLVIMTAGSIDTKDSFNDRASGIMPVIDLNMAREIQQILLKKSSVQKVVMS